MREGSPGTRRLIRLPDEKGLQILTLAACLPGSTKSEGPLFHRWAAEWLDLGDPDPGALYDWIGARLAVTGFGRRCFEKAKRRAEELQRRGFWIAAPQTAPPGEDNVPSCPRVLFALGGVDLEITWNAVFNSRKPRSVGPDTRWPADLRRCLDEIKSNNEGLACSVGARTYDMATAWAERSKSPLLLVLPVPMEELDDPKSRAPFGPGLLLRPSLTCLARALNCPKPARMVCRDRILALVADVYRIFDIRPGGNLHSALEQARRCRPGVRVAHEMKRTAPGPGRPDRPSEGSQILRIPDSRPPEADAHSARQAPEPAWDRFLFHYTRSQPGPWPGESYEEYLLSLLDGAPHAAHSALDSLIRIVSEGTLRGGSKLVRGEDPVVSWTSIPPFCLGSIRRWNRALIRWTFEPYGIAVTRGRLRSAGAAPVIYARDADYERLRPSDGFRYQRHEPPGCMWKKEREWRLRGDFSLRGVPPEEIFVFVASEADAERLRAFTPAGISVFFPQSQSFGPGPTRSIPGK